MDIRHVIRMALMGAFIIMLYALPFFIWKANAQVVTSVTVEIPTATTTSYGVTMSANVEWNNCNIRTTKHPAPVYGAMIDTGTELRVPMGDGTTIYYTWINDTLLGEWQNAWFVYDGVEFRYGPCDLLD